MEISVLGIDLARSVFQLHGVNAAGKAKLRKRLSRGQLHAFVANLHACLIGMEACGGSNYWAREFQKLGHQVKLMSPQFVKPYVKSNKNDAADAEAICEALTRPSMRFVSPKSIEQQDIQSLHRVRSRLVGSRTALVNEIRGLLGEYGIALPRSVGQVRKNLAGSVEKAVSQGQMTTMSGQTFADLADELREVDEARTDAARSATDAARQRLEDEVGDLFFALVNLARTLKVNPEEAMRRAANRFAERFAFMERAAKAGGRTLADLTLAEMDRLWDEAKASERREP